MDQRNAHCGVALARVSQRCCNWFDCFSFLFLFLFLLFFLLFSFLFFFLFGKFYQSACRAFHVLNSFLAFFLRGFFIAIVSCFASLRDSLDRLSQTLFTWLAVNWFNIVAITTLSSVREPNERVKTRRATPQSLVSALTFKNLSTASVSTPSARQWSKVASRRSAKCRWWLVAHLRLAAIIRKAHTAQRLDAHDDPLIQFAFSAPPARLAPPLLQLDRVSFKYPVRFALAFEPRTLTGQIGVSLSCLLCCRLKTTKGCRAYHFARALLERRHGFASGTRRSEWSR